MDLVEKLMAGNEKACARCLSLVENQREGYLDLLRAIRPHGKGAYRVGFTGPAGRSKSKLLADLLEEYLKEDKKIGLFLMGPSSPRTGGAFLGNRGYFSQFAQDNRVFVRSVASRGHQGGISYALAGMVEILDAYGCDLILVNGLGGPLDTDLASLVDCLVDVVAPCLGQDMDMLNAGSMEQAQLFFVNQGDGDQGEKTRLDIEMMLDLQEDREDRPLVLNFHDQGPGALKEALDKYQDHLVDRGKRPRQKLKQEVLEVQGHMDRYLKEDLARVICQEQGAIEKALEEGEDPLSLGEGLLKKYFK